MREFEFEVFCFFSSFSSFPIFQLFYYFIFLVKVRRWTHLNKIWWLRNLWKHLHYQRMRKREEEVHRMIWWGNFQTAPFDEEAETAWRMMGFEAHPWSLKPEAEHDICQQDHPHHLSSNHANAFQLYHVNPVHLGTPHLHGGQCIRSPQTIPQTPAPPSSPSQQAPKQHPSLPHRHGQRCPPPAVEPDNLLPHPPRSWGPHPAHAGVRSQSPLTMRGPYLLPASPQPHKHNHWPLVDLTGLCGLGHILRDRRLPYAFTPLRPRGHPDPHWHPDTRGVNPKNLP